MILAAAPFDAEAARRSEGARIPALGTAVVLAMVALGAALEIRGGALRDLGRALASGGVHCGMLALGWIAAASRDTPRRALLWTGGALALASLATAVSPWGALVYLAPPLILVRGAARLPEFRRVGLDVGAGVRYLPLGAAAGAFLGIHLLVSASMTLGYAIRVEGLAHYAAAVGYDAGANALTAEWLFRGALFSRWWRRSEFWPAAGVATGLAVLRYLADPALPLAIEVRAGAVFYMGVLGLTACALRAASGSLLPGYAATVAFFAAYRTLAP